MPNRLGDLQFSKIKRSANLDLSLCELLNSAQTWVLVFSRWISLGMLTDFCLRIFSGAANPKWRVGVGYLLLAIPMGKMTEVTRCDRLMRVHNGWNPITAQLYLRNK